VDTNPFVSSKDPCLQHYERQIRQKYPERYRRGQAVEAPNIFVRIMFKVKATFEVLSNPIILKFLCFFILTGVTMPNFDAFDYMYSIDHLKIPLFLINIQSLIVGNFGFIMPWIYLNYFKDKDYKVMFGIG